jgi:NADPH:quinone reductase-like Zn-dependent oxidoreductase
VCDRELRAFVRRNPPRPPNPATLGYEMVGVIEEVETSVTELRVGDLVHVGTPHREETVLNIDAAAKTRYPLPSGRRTAQARAVREPRHGCARRCPRRPAQAR